MDTYSHALQLSLVKWSLVLGMATFQVLGASNVSDAGPILDRVRARGEVRCGVGEGIIGFSAKDSSGKWTGIDADFCRAVAAAVLGNPEKVKFVPIRLSGRLPALQSQAIDLLVRYTSWTLSREVLLNVHFAGVLLLDGQAFLASRASGVTRPADLAGKTICVHEKTTNERNLRDYLEAQELNAEPVIIESGIEDLTPLLSGKCVAYTGPAAALTALLLRIPNANDRFVILPQRISTEMFSPAVLRGDDDWFSIVRLTLAVLFLAEQHGLSSASLDSPVPRTRAPAMRQFAELSQGPWRKLGLGEDWVRRVIRAVGNYGEMFERNLGQESPLKLERGPNRPWTQGGLIMVPPIR